VRREGDAVRLFTRHGFDWPDRYPAIARTALALPAKSCTLDACRGALRGVASDPRAETTANPRRRTLTVEGIRHRGIAVFADLNRRGVGTDAASELVAVRILEPVRDGESDPDRLTDAAVATFEG
jgi:hypothetical protein